MKISNIKNNNFLVLKNNKTFKKNIFKQSCDILDINFGARNKNKEESSKVQEVF